MREAWFTLGLTLPIAAGLTFQIILRWRKR